MTTPSRERRNEAADLDLVGVADISRRLGVPRTTVSMWHARRSTTGFPLPVGTPSMGPVFDYQEVKRWHQIWLGTQTDSLI